MNVKVLIREAVGEDIEPCAQLIAQQETEDVETWRQRFEENLQDANRQFLVALHDERVIGYGHTVHYFRPEDASLATSPSGYFLSGLLVAPNYRRDGVGTGLTIARLDVLRGLTDEVFYVADPANIATIELHRRLGFVELRSFERDQKRVLLFRLGT
jgi:ribosomal protein S18 acetylase RimI-like enzyme